MMGIRPLTFALCLLAVAPLAQARTWTDATGRYTVEADLIAFNDHTVVIERADHELGAVPIDKLSAADHEYLKSKEAADVVGRAANEMQTWTLRSGLKVIGRVVDYGRRQLTLQRRGGKIYVNDRLFDELPAVYQAMLPKIVGHFEKLPIDDKRGLESWLVRQKGQPRTFNVEGVVLQLEKGDTYGVPLFFFTDADLSLLRPGWERWLAANDDTARQSEESFMVRSLAAARQRDKQVDRQIALMQLQLQAVQAGMTALWEVTLYPARGNTSAPRWVVVPGRDSRQATALALEQNPGYAAGPVRRVSGRY
jgi:SLA1 homology domain 1, SHD1